MNVQGKYRFDLESIKQKYNYDALGDVFITRSGPNSTEGVKRYFDRRTFAANNKEYQAAKRKWLSEMDKFLDGKIKVQPKMPRLEDFGYKGK